MPAKRTASEMSAVDGRPVQTPDKGSSRKSARTKVKSAHPSGSLGRTGIIVLGMHRSGTSALGGVLGKLGCDLPATEMPGSPANEKGFFESKRIYEMHEDLLDALGITWSDWQPMQPAWLKSHRAATFREKAIEALQAEFGESGLFVLKDPRICRLLPLWTSVIQDFGRDMVIVHTHRNPLNVASSLERRNRLPLLEGMMIWLRYVIDAEANSRGMRRCFTSYGRLLKNWPRETTRIEDQLGLILPRKSLSVSREIDAFLTRDLQHFDHDADDLFGNLTIADWVRDIYAILERWAETGEDPRDHITFDQVNQAFSATAPIFGPMLETPEERAVRNKTAAALIAARADLEATAETGKGLSNQLAKLEETCDSQAAALDAARADLKATADTNKDLSEQVAKLEEICDSQAVTLDEAQGALSQAQSALAQRTHETDEKTRTIAEFSDQIADLKASLQARDNKVSEVSAALENAQHQLQISYSELAQMARMLSETENRHSENQEEAHTIIKGLRADLASTQKNNHALKTQLETTVEKTTTERKRLEGLLNETRRAKKVQRDQLEGALRDVHTSTSWRLTRPLRALVRLVRRR